MSITNHEVNNELHMCEGPNLGQSPIYSYIYMGLAEAWVVSRAQF